VEAYEDIKNKGMSVRSAAKKYNLCHVSLLRYKRKKEAAVDNINLPVEMGIKLIIKFSLKNRKDNYQNI